MDRFSGAGAPVEIPQPPPIGYSCPGQRHIRVAVHFMTRATPIYNQDKFRLEYNNFTEFDDGAGDTKKQNAFTYAEALIWSLAVQQDGNALNDGSSYSPLPPKRYNFVLYGVYVHRTDDENVLLYDGTNADSKLLNDTYGVNRDSVINLFVMEINTATETDRSIRGIAGRGPASHYPWLGPPSKHTMWSKVLNAWHNYHNNPNNASISWEQSKLVAHELGHLWDLGHTNLVPQQCSDAPMSASTNNVMRSGSICQCALTPCQVDIANQTIDQYGSPYLYNCGCRPSTAFATLPEQVCNSNTPIFLDARACFNEGGYELEIYRTKAPGSHTISGNHWQQSFTGEAGRIDLRSLYSFAGGTYRVKLTTITNGGSCPGDVVIKWVQTYLVSNPLTCLPAQQRPAHGSIPLRVEVQPNPATDYVVIRTFKPTGSPLSLRFYDSFGRARFATATSTAVVISDDGWQSVTYPATAFGPGVFRVDVLDDGQHGSATFVVQP